MACSAVRSAISGLVSVRRLLRMFAARAGSETNGYVVFPFAAAAAADLLTIGTAAARGLLARRVARGLGTAELAPSCGACFATRKA